MENYKNIYLIGIGGIGMSAIARYFLHKGCWVGGYDRVETSLTIELQNEGAEIHYEDKVESIPEKFRDSSSTLVVYTPAVPSDHSELLWFREQGFTIEKRSQILGRISEGKYVMAVAGTHGKTTIATLTAWLNSQAADGSSDSITGRQSQGGAGGGSAFLGGLSRNFNSNLLLGEGRRLAVEADEFDRSFLQLYPDVAVVSSVDADHLDIFGTHQAIKDAFSAFIGQIKKGGTLILKKGVELEIENKDITIFRYSFDDTTAAFYAKNIELLEGGRYRFDIVCPDRTITRCVLGIPGWVNIENAVAAVAMIWVAGFDEDKLRTALADFKGVKRRFEFYINTPTLVYMDDYAHHPRELVAAITSIKKMLPGRSMMAVFQPHLYSRTRDFYPQFAEALSYADEVIILPIYPARELPIEGIESELIAKSVTVPCQIIEKERIVEHLSAHKKELDIVVTFGAGDISNYCEQIAQVLK